MKHLLLTTIAAVLVVGCGNPEADKALRFAAKSSGNIEAAKQAIDDGADVNAKDKRGRTPLLFAAIGGHKEIAEILIAKGADVSPKSPEYKAGITPLHEAAFHGHKEIVELLINKGADVNAKNVDGKTPLDYAIENNHTNIADLLRKHEGKTGKELEAKKRHIGWQRSR